LQEAFDEVERNRNGYTDIIVIPPDPDVMTDDDEVADTDGEPGMPNVRIIRIMF
jgi:hypothetical protein